MGFIFEKIKTLLVIGLFTLSVACGGGGGSTPTPTIPTTPLATGGFDKLVEFGLTPTTWTNTFSSSTPRLQFLYRASNLQGSGSISSIKFRYNTTEASAVTCPNIIMKMGHTSLTALTTTFATNVEQGKGSAVTVINDAARVIPAGTSGDYFEITLDTPFNYNGVDNLVVELSRSTACDGLVQVRADADIDVAYDAAAYHSTNNVAVTATAVDLNAPHVKFVFAGGENDISYPSATTTAPEPFSTTATEQHVQQLHLANKVNGSGPVTGIAMLFNGVTSARNYTVNIKLGHTTLSTLTNTFASNFDSGSPTSVASAQTFTIPSGIPPNTPIWLPLTGSFDYNGTDNLIVDIEVTAASGAQAWLTDAVSSNLVGTVGDLTGTVGTTAYHTVFRFNGSLVQVMPTSGGTSVRQALGGMTTTGAGQVQSLYPPSIVGTSGTVTSVSVRLLADSVAATIPNYKIYMGNTIKTQYSLADTYSSNMELNQTLVFSGSFDIPAGLKAGDWITIPLQTNFVYDATKNMSILFMADSASPGNNDVSASSDASWFLTHLIGRNDNTVDITGTPAWGISAILDVQLNITK